MRTLRVSLMAAVTLAVFALPVAAETLTTWDTVIAGPGRFRLLAGFNNAAVLDKRPGSSGSGRRIRARATGLGRTASALTGRWGTALAKAGGCPRCRRS